MFAQQIFLLAKSSPSSWIVEFSLSLSVPPSFSLYLSIALTILDGWIVLYVLGDFFFIFTPFYRPSPRVPGAGLEGSCFLKGRGAAETALHSLRAGCFIEPRSESGGVTQAKGGLRSGVEGPF